MRLKDELPVDHHLATVYRWGAALCGCILLVFGCLGFADALSPFDTSGDQIAGMTTNTALSVISVVFGLVLLAGAAVGGNVASTANMIVGVSFLLSGFYHLFVLDRPANFLDFGVTNVMFSFLMGLLILTFGMYGRVSGRLPHDNPYWRRRHARQAAAESLARRRAAAAIPARVERATPPTLSGTSSSAIPEDPSR